MAKVAIIALLLALFCQPPHASATDFYVETTTDNTGTPASCDPGDGCSLRQAINVANGDASPPHTIHVPSGTYTISASGALPTIVKSISITGAGDANTTIDGDSTYQIFLVNNSTATLTVNDMSVTNGLSTGTGGCVDILLGNLAINDSTFSGCSSLNGGGAIFNNSTTNTINITGTTFTSNNVTGPNGGGAIKTATPVSVTDSTFTTNTSNSEGGAIYIVDNTLDITNCTFTSNTTGNKGGAAFISTAKAMTVTNSTIETNHAYSGAGLFSYGSIKVENSLLYANTTTSTPNSGGAIYSAGIEIYNSTLSENSGTGGGGGVYNTASPCIVKNSTFYKNIGKAWTGTSLHSTVAGCTVSNSVFLLPEFPVPTGIYNCYNFTNGVNNIEKDDNPNNYCGSTTGRIYDTDANLQALADNDGPTKTHAILDTSPAYDTGDWTTCTDADVNTLDQRGKTRAKQGSETACDRGAYELAPPAPPVGGYTTDNEIPTAQITEDTGHTASSIITITWKGRDDDGDNVILKTFQYSVDGGSSWNAPTNGDASTAFSTNWTDSDGAGTGYNTAVTFGDAAEHSFTLNTSSADLTGLANINQSDVRVRFYLEDLTTLTSALPVTSGNFEVNNDRATVIIVTKNADTNDGTCSLTDCSVREAITAANADASDDHNIEIPSDTYTIGSIYPTITKNMSLQGDGIGSSIFEGQDLYSFFYINNVAITASFKDMTMQHGNAIASAIGGAINNNSGNIEVDNCKFHECHSTIGGGAIWMADATSVNSLTVSDSIFEGCYASNADRDGGAIRANGPTSITNSTFTANHAGDLGGAIYTYTSSLATVQITGSTFKDNYSGNKGGSLYNLAGSTEITGCTFNTEVGPSGGGAIMQISVSKSLSITESTFSNCSSTNSGALGGAIQSYSPTTITDSTFSTNSAHTTGGAIYTFAGSGMLLDITGSTFYDNSTTLTGGAIGAGRNTAASDSYGLKISDSTFTQNHTVYMGGCIYAKETATEISDSTFNSNTVTTTSTAQTYYGGGAIYTHGVKFYNSTFSENSEGSASGAGGAIYNQSYTGGITDGFIENCTFYKNAAPGSQGSAICSNISTTITNNLFYTDTATYNDNCRYSASNLTTGGHNFDNDTNNSCNFNTEKDDAINTNPGFSALAANGGVQGNGDNRLTHAISNSALLGDYAVCTDAAYVNSLDQRGEDRTVAGTCFSGSYEYFPPLNTAPVGGYTADNIIPEAQVVQATDGTGTVTVTWKGHDDDIDNVTLFNFEYSLNNGAWTRPTNDDSSTALSDHWTDYNSEGVGFKTGINFETAPAHSFSFNLEHSDISALNDIESTNLRIHFWLNDGTADSTESVNTESFNIDSLPPTCNIETSGTSYDLTSNTMVIAGHNFTTMAASGDVKSYVDWSKFVWDIDDGTAGGEINFVEGNIESLTVTSDTVLTLVLKNAKATEIEGTAGFGNSPDVDYLTVTAGFCRDDFGNAATTDAYDSLLYIKAPVIGVSKVSSVISDPVNGTNGKQKRIPGAIIEYIVSVGNSGDLAADNITITDVIDNQLAFNVDCGVEFIDGTGSTVSGLTLGAVTFSDDAGPGYTYDYTPTGPFDDAVTSFNAPTTGNFAFNIETTVTPTFSLKYQVQID